MTYQIDIVDDTVVGEKKMKVADGNGDYVRLGYLNDVEAVGFGGQGDESRARGCCSFCWWMKAVFFCVFVLVAAACFFIWGGPFLINKVVVPVLDWEMGAFSTPVLGFLLFVSMALFPALLLPSAPSMWIAGMTFGYGYGFLLIMAATSLGMSLPYFIGSLFRRRIHKWLDRWPEKSAIIRLAGEGNWLHQFRAVALLRISPFPYIIFNYAVVATNVNYGPYIFGSLVGTVPEVFLTIYSGILIRSLADATQGHQFLSLQQIIYDAIGFCVAVAATAAVTIYAKRTLQKLQTEEELE
ncbi:transmembrane protein 64 isoform X1 [Cinnamomum micranthum f. kanehirae]|uniref:Transmembrane protein 64 isoform X1 n=1 Tax=Cinnamomum micranthum f. kanehirae TaxID=337451 RepID=A0A443NQA7_9MAGN|nr:transmembrane protein 64 isoform X1 [Cinnamomum micranthum f. kanehirae]